MNLPEGVKMRRTQQTMIRGSMRLKYKNKTKYINYHNVWKIRTGFP